MLARCLKFGLSFHIHSYFVPAACEQRKLFAAAKSTKPSCVSYNVFISILIDRNRYILLQQFKPQATFSNKIAMFHSKTQCSQLPDPGIHFKGRFVLLYNFAIEIQRYLFLRIFKTVLF